MLLKNKIISVILGRIFCIDQRLCLCLLIVSYDFYFDGQAPIPAASLLTRGEIIYFILCNGIRCNVTVYIPLYVICDIKL